MMPANYPKRKLGQVDLINISAVDYQFGWTQIELHPKGEYSPTLLVSQCISVQMNLDYMSNEGPDPGIHAEVPLTLELVIGH